MTREGVAPLATCACWHKYTSTPTPIFCLPHPPDPSTPTMALRLCSCCQQLLPRSTWFRHRQAAEACERHGKEDHHVQALPPMTPPSPPSLSSSSSTSSTSSSLTGSLPDAWADIDHDDLDNHLHLDDHEEGAAPPTPGLPLGEPSLMIKLLRWKAENNITDLAFRQLCVVLWIATSTYRWRQVAALTSPRTMEVGERLSSSRHSPWMCLSAMLTPPPHPPPIHPPAISTRIVDDAVVFCITAPTQTCRPAPRASAEQDWSVLGRIDFVPV